MLQDFGIKERPEGYESGADKVYARLNEVGQSEMKRLNLEQRHGEVKFDDKGDLHGKYYKEVKVYESFHPTDAQPTPRSAAGERGYNGYVEYSYRIFQSARKPNRAEALAETASVPTDERGRETYRYRFNSSGFWIGGSGETVR